MIRSRWALAEALTGGTTLETLVRPDPFDSIRVAVMWHHRCPTQLILLGEMLHATWTEQSLAAFQRSSFTFPLEHIIQQALLQVDALAKTTVNPKKRGTLTKSQEILCTLLEHHARHYDHPLSGGNRST